MDESRTSRPLHDDVAVYMERKHSQGGIPTGGDCRKAIQPRTPRLRDTEYTVSAGGKDENLSHLPNGE